MATDNKPKIVLRETKTNPKTGESETWEHETGNSTPVSKTLPNVTVTPPEEPTPHDEREAAPPAPANEEELKARRRELHNHLGPALEKYGKDHKNIWEAGGYKKTDHIGQ